MIACKNSKAAGANVVPVPYSSGVSERVHGDNLWGSNYAPPPQEAMTTTTESTAEEGGDDDDVGAEDGDNGN